MTNFNIYCLIQINKCWSIRLFLYIYNLKKANFILNNKVIRFNKILESTLQLTFDNVITIIYIE